MKANFLSLIMMAATLAMTAAPQTTAAEKIWPARGVVQSPLDGDQGIVIAHEDLPGLMPAMTMRFTVANPAEARSLKAGDQVSFRLHVGGKSWTVSDFMVEGHVAQTPPTPRTGGATPRLRKGDAVPDFSIITEANRALTSADLRGHLTVVTFIFTRCPVPDYCPAMALRFAELQKAILDDSQLAAGVRLLSITLDPEFDRPPVLKSYGKAVGANPAVWNFATGSSAEIATLTKAFSVFNERNGAVLDHTLCTALIDARGRVAELWRGTVWRPAEVLQAISAEVRK